ncbi:MAG: PIG-L family deacetylase [Deltaproteobacteria bacterium]|uniref:PIG-L family deacetylase n=1 Tax=Candidatus Zymogenus saltonus TaxID=2844893 RepID=A0A9D8KHC7_9DELT|nr:PIG-L family deacetylase [Candidatus Zymogenus saltonus]
MNILVLAAHPDDEVLGCGATIAKLADEKHDVFIAILGEGITSRYQDREKVDKSLLRGIQDCSRNAAGILNAKDVFFYDLPDNRFDTVPLLEVIKIIEDLAGKVEPDIVFTHHGGDLNIDHVIVHRATLTALRPVSKKVISRICSYEVPSSTEWAFNQFEPYFRPNMFVDVSNTLERKIEAIKAYDTEIRQFPHPRSPEALRSIANRWGSTAGLEAAEAFEIIRLVC